MHIAFITDEFVTGLSDAGGLARYADRISRALVEQGHDVEVFTCGEPGVVVREGVRVTCVPQSDPLVLKVMDRVGSLNWRLARPRVKTALRIAWAFAKSVHHRHREHPFDFVQSANTSASGVFLSPGIKQLLRLSSARDLWFTTDRIARRDNRSDLFMLARLERIALRRAHVAYAPSQFLADYMGKVHGCRVRVLRPPLNVDDTVGEWTEPLPKKFLIHFGSLMRRKGTDLVGRALTEAWQTEPELTMVWAGRELEPGIEANARADWSSAQNERLISLGPLARPALGVVLRKALASVLPSRVDNLPNTLIESLAAGVGVIGSAGASIDELVEPGRSGELVAVGDASALAAAMVKAWRGEADWQRHGFVLPAVMQDYDEAAAARALLALAMSVE